MRLFIAMIASCCFFVLQLRSENEIPNPSFEEGGGLCKPDDDSQIDGFNGCPHWDNFNTSDWLTDKVGSPCANGGPLFNGNYDITGSSNGDEDAPNLPILDAYHGDYYAGFGPCEGIQVKLNHEVGGVSKMIRISFWFSPRTREDTKINVYLLRDQADAFADCNDPGISTEVSFEVEINSAGADAIHNPGSWYYFEKIIYPCPGSPVYEYFAIKGENGTFLPSPLEERYRARRYIYVDDFTLEEEDFCNHPCAITNNGGGYMAPSANDPNFPNATSGTPSNGAYWSVELNNIIGYKFTVFDGGWNGVYDGSPGIYYIEEFDPNGLSYNGGPWVVSWTGENSFGNCVQVGVYPIVLEFWNCVNHVYVFGKFIAYLGDGCSTIEPITSPCFNDPGCNQRLCDPSITLTSPPLVSLYQASNFVNASDQCQIDPSDRIDFIAGDEIVLGDGFVAEEGSEFRARIAPCNISSERLLNVDSATVVSNKSAARNDPRRPFDRKLAGDTISHGINYQSAGVFYCAPFSIGSTIRVFNVTGQEIARSFDGRIDITGQPTGIYFYRIETEQNITAEGTLHKLE